jgi:hypothetical protein
MPIQIIESKKLSEHENIWLKNLSNELNTSGLARLTEEIYRQGKAAELGAYVKAIYALTKPDAVKDFYTNEQLNTPSFWWYSIILYNTTT